ATRGIGSRPGRGVGPAPPVLPPLRHVFPARRSAASVPLVTSLFKKPVRVRGHIIPARRFTGWALAYVLLFVGLPVTVLMLLLDLAGWAVTVKLLGASCYGIGCLMG
ncbi:MAG TPA: hypothetical protein VIR38_03365, partial [Thalassobaculum sp.]